MAYDNLIFRFSLPLRVPDLRRFIRREDFRYLHRDAAAWTGRHFDLLEAGAPWLHPAGRFVHDFCKTEKAYRRHLGGSSLIIDYWGAPRVRCERSVSAVYGADGPLARRREDLKAALSGLGWSQWGIPMSLIEGETTRTGTQDDSRPGVWHPVPELGTPPVFRFNTHAHWYTPDPLRGLSVSWVSRGKRGAEVPPRVGGRVSRAASPLRQLVESSDPLGDVVTLSARALDGHEHAVSLHLHLTYYWNADTNAKPRRIRRRPRPVWWAN